MGEGVQGIFNGCSNINNCRKKLNELKGVLEALSRRDDDEIIDIEKKITMVKDTIA